MCHPEEALAGPTMLGCKVYGSLNNSALKVTPVDELLRCVEDKIPLHEHSRARRPQARQHVLCNRSTAVTPCSSNGSSGR